MDIRGAQEGDLEGIAIARLSNGSAHDDSGADAGYCRFLIEHGHLLVGVEGSTVLGFAGAVDVGEARLLSDLYVHSSAHGRGVGRALLLEVMSGSSGRFTFASNDPAALPIYARSGMLAWWPLLALHGSTAALPVDPSLSATVVDVAVIAHLELVTLGLDRTATHHYWAGRPDSHTVTVHRGPQLVAFGAVRVLPGATRVEHLVAPAGTEVAAIDALAAIGRLMAQPALHAYVPGCSSSAVELMHAGFVVADSAVHMASEVGLVDPRLCVVHPGLC